MDFHEFYKKYWDDLTFWEKMRFRIERVLFRINYRFQVITYKLFGIDWVDKDD